MHCRGPLRISQLLLVGSQLQEGSTSIPRAGIVASLCRKLDSSYASAYIRSANKERPRPRMFMIGQVRGSLQKAFSRLWQHDPNQPDNSPCCMHEMHAICAHPCLPLVSRE